MYTPAPIPLPPRRPAVVSSLDRRLERAREHVLKMWFPADPELLKRVRAGLADGAYDLDIDFLLDEIRDDFALFTFCLKGLSKLLAEEEVQPPVESNPLAILRWAGLPRLKQIFAGDDSSISFHNLRELSDFQAARLKEALVSASAAEVLAEHSDIDPESGYSTALLRQLGLTLIAWNYPALYRRSLAAQDSDGLDEVLSRALGFSPALLGAAVMRDWPLAREIHAAVTEPGRQKRSSPPSRLEHLCRIGEMLARSNDPEHHPSAPADWDNARKEIDAAIGREGLDLIRARTRDNSSHYANLDIVGLDDIAELDPARRVHIHTGTALLKANVFVKHCPPLLARKIKDLYANITPRRIDRANINTLIREIIPAAGFSAGVIYILDPIEPRLVPRLKMSEPKLRAMKTIPLAATADTLITAFQCQSPVQETSIEGIGIIAGAIGGSHRAGVFYLEFPQILGSGPRLLASFKAIRQTLNDCLGLHG